MTTFILKSDFIFIIYINCINYIDYINNIKLTIIYFKLY